MKRVIYTTAIVLAFTLASRDSLAQNAAADVYKAKCEMCHGADGLADTPVGKSLGAHAYTSPDVMKLTDVQIIDVIKNGKNKMPPLNPPLPDDQIKSLVAYVHSLQKKK